MRIRRYVQNIARSTQIQPHAYRIYRIISSSRCYHNKRLSAGYVPCKVQMRYSIFDERRVWVPTRTAIKKIFRAIDTSTKTTHKLSRGENITHNEYISSTDRRLNRRYLLPLDLIMETRSSSTFAARGWKHWKSCANIS